MSQENNFVPEQGSYKPLTPFQLFVKSNFPFIEATYEALDNYGLYCKVVEYLNNVIENENTVEDNVTALYNSFVSLNGYVSNYFDNLDVQEEINNKLDEMATNGDLQIILAQLYDELENETNEKIDNLRNYTNSQLNSLNTQIASIDSSPAGVYATAAALAAANPNHERIYVVTADNKWYYWNSSNNTWTAGGTYQSAGIGNNSVYFDNLSGTLQNYFRDSQIELGAISNTNGTDTSSTTRVRTNKKFYLLNNSQIVGLTNKKFDYSMTTYATADKSYVAQTGWSKGSAILGNNDYYTRFMFRKSDNSDFTDSDIKELANSFYIAEKTPNKLDTKLISNLNIENLDSSLKYGIIGEKTEFEYTPAFIVGNLLSNGTFAGAVSNDNKTTVEYLEKCKATFTIKEGFMSKITYFDMDNTFVSQSIWTSATDADKSVSYEIPEKAKITIASIEGVSVGTYDLSEMIENFKISKNDSIYKTLKNSNIYFSFDDVSRSFAKLISNYAIYNSLFDEPFFAYLKQLHEIYGAKFSLYVWDIPTLSTLGNKFKNDFIKSSDWLKIGFHAYNTGSLQNVSPEDAKTQYESFVSAVCTFACFENIDHIPRLNLFYATTEQLLALKTAKGKILGILTPDDDRTVPYLTQAQNDYLYENDNIVDLTNGLYYYSTNFRLDTFMQGFSSNYNYHENTYDNPYDELVYRYSNADYANYMNNLVVFTHEWQLYNTNQTFNATMKQYIEQVMQFANDYKLEHDYIQNKVTDITFIS